MIRYGLVMLNLAAAAALVAMTGCESTPTKTESTPMKKVDTGTKTQTNVSQQDFGNPKSDVMSYPCPVGTTLGREGGPCEPQATQPPPAAPQAAAKPAEPAAPKELTMGAMCAGQSLDVPQAADSGQCYAKVWNEPKFTTTPQRTLVRAAGERITVVPARYEKVKEPVIVKPATKEYRTIPAQYDTVTERVLVRPAYVRTDTIPAMYDIIEEKQLVKGAYKTWKKGTMTNIQRVDPQSGDIMCLVDVPAEYKTVTRRELRVKEQTTSTQVPAEYVDVKKTVLKTPERVEEVDIPAVSEMREYDKLVEPAKQVKVPVDAQYADVPMQQLAQPGCYAWRQILCDNNMTQATITKLQLALQKAGYYQGQPTGKFDDATMAAVNGYERANNLPIDGYLNIETAKSLGIAYVQ